MCYSAQIEADYREYVKLFGANMDIREFARLYSDRAEGSKLKVPKALDDAILQSSSDELAGLRSLIERFNAGQTTLIEQDLFKQRERLAKAERALQTKVTKVATESQRIATDKIAAALRRLDDIRRRTPKDRDSRIFPGTYAPLMVMEDGNLVIKPMRYQCRVAGKPANYDVRYPAT